MNTHDDNRPDRKLNKLLIAATLAGLGLGGGALVLAEGARDARLDPAAYPVTEQQAIDTALARVPGQVLGTELEDEDGVIAWEVEIAATTDGSEHELTIDATSGEVLSLAEDDEDNKNE